MHTSRASRLLTAHLLALLSTAFAQESSQEAPPPAETSVFCDRFLKTGFWDIDIENRPALPPECGPPLAFNSDRDLTHLPYHIAAICASYIACAVFIGIAILAIKRKRKSLLVPAPVELKLVGNESKKFGLSPASPALSFSSWMRNPLSRKKATSVVSSSSELHGSALSSPGMDSVMSFDRNILNTDRNSRKAEMEKLYAAVMAHDAARASQISHQPGPKSDAGSVRSMPRGSGMPRASLADTMPRASLANTMPRASMGQTMPRKSSDRRLQQLAHLDTQVPVSPISLSHVPQTPKSPIRAIYPPDHDMTTVPLSPTSPVRATVPDDFWPQPGKTPMPIYSTKNLPATPGPITPGLMSPGIQKVELPNDMYPASPPPGERRMRFPGQQFPPTPNVPITPISPGPMSAALHGPSSRVPLPHDMYPASPPPLQTMMNIPDPVRPPASPRSFASAESLGSKSSRGRKMLQNMRINTGINATDSDREERAPLSATFANNGPQGPKDDSTTPDTPESTELEDRFESLNSTIPAAPQSGLGPQGKKPSLTLQLPQPRRQQSQSSISTVGSGVPGSPASLRKPPPSALKVGPGPSALKNGGSQAPDNASAPGTGGSKPLPFRVAFSESSKAAPTPVKTTFLERRKEILGRGLLSAKTPMTGVPQTPYSAYMPFTPMTPVTPRLISKHERKQKKKEMGKTLLDESDMVKEADEEWD